MQREKDFAEKDGICFFVFLCCKFDANNFEAVLVLVTEVLLFSRFACLGFVPLDCGPQLF